MFTHRSGRAVASAILLIPIVDELLASTAFGGATWSSSANTARFNARSSYTASMTKSAPVTASARSEVVRTRESASSASAWPTFPFSTRRMMCPRFDSTAVVSCSELLSCSLTSTPHNAACCAIWAPMLPAPMTPKRIISPPPSGGGQGGGGGACASLDREDSRHPVERRDVRHEPIDLQLAAEQLESDAPAHLVVVHRQAKGPDLQVAQAHYRFRLGANRDRAPRLQSVVYGQPAGIEDQCHAFVDVGDPDAHTRDQRVEVLPLIWIRAHVGLDQTSEHLGKRAGLLARVLDERGLFRGGLYLSSGHSTATRVVHSVISCDAFVYRTIVGRSPFSLSLPWSIPFVASSSFIATCFQRVYGAVITKSHFCASLAGPTVMSRASPSKRSITTPRDSGKFLSGSASTTSPTVHFHPFPADL